MTLSPADRPAGVLCCPICASGTRAWRRTSEVSIVRCGTCGHRQATFSPSHLDADYHEQYVQGPRLEALRATRERQAKLIFGAIRRHVPNADDVLDFGAGRGWFLKTCRDQGLRRGVAADTSQLAVQAAVADGFDAVLLPAGESSGDVVSVLHSLPYRPRVVTLLDVVEHFTPARMQDHLAEIIDALKPELEVAVVKVPVAEGMLHRGASTVAKLRVSGPLEQLYQVGTSPPHYNYFSRRSLITMARNLGWTVLETVDDRDFEPASLEDRALALQRLPAGVRRLAGRVLGEAAARMPMPDSRILLARV